MAATSSNSPTALLQTDAANPWATGIISTHQIAAFAQQMRLVIDRSGPPSLRTVTSTVLHHLTFDVGPWDDDVAGILKVLCPVPSFRSALLAQPLLLDNLMEQALKSDSNVSDFNLIANALLSSPLSVPIRSTTFSRFIEKRIITAAIFQTNETLASLSSILRALGPSSLEDHENVLRSLHVLAKLPVLCPPESTNDSDALSAPHYTFSRPGPNHMVDLVIHHVISACSAMDCDQALVIMELAMGMVDVLDVGVSNTWKAGHPITMDILYEKALRPDQHARVLCAALSFLTAFSPEHEMSEEQLGLYEIVFLAQNPAAISPLALSLYITERHPDDVRLTLLKVVEMAAEPKPTCLPMVADIQNATQFLDSVLLGMSVSPSLRLALLPPASSDHLAARLRAVMQLQSRHTPSRVSYRNHSVICPELLAQLYEGLHRRIALVFLNTTLESSQVPDPVYDPALKTHMDHLTTNPLAGMHCKYRTYFITQPEKPLKEAMERNTWLQQDLLITEGALRKRQEQLEKTRKHLEEAQSAVRSGSEVIQGLTGAPQPKFGGQVRRQNTINVVVKKTAERKRKKMNDMQSDIEMAIRKISSVRHDFDALTASQDAGRACTHAGSVGHLKQEIRDLFWRSTEAKSARIATNNKGHSDHSPY
ncbi:MAG: hypothetical protein Q9163_003970 [Psora crenata]